MLTVRWHDHDKMESKSTFPFLKVFHSYIYTLWNSILPWYKRWDKILGDFDSLKTEQILKKIIVTAPGDSGFELFGLSLDWTGSGT